MCSLNLANKAVKSGLTKDVVAMSILIKFICSDREPWDPRTAWDELYIARPSDDENSHCVAQRIIEFVVNPV